MPLLALHPTLQVLPEARRRHLVRTALHCWREGDDEIRAPHRVATRARYERAVTRVIRSMRLLTTMESLLGAYYVDRAPLARLTEHACRAAGGEAPLSRNWVRDAAFWRRFRSLISHPN